jgi:hypothetical protein
MPPSWSPTDKEEWWSELDIPKEERWPELGVPKVVITDLD